MNLVVTETPFGEDRQLAHRDARDGNADWGAGHVDDADLTLTTDYVTAREIFMSAATRRPACRRSWRAR